MYSVLGVYFCQKCLTKIGKKYNYGKRKRRLELIANRTGLTLSCLGTRYDKGHRGADLEAPAHKGRRGCKLKS